MTHMFLPLQGPVLRETVFSKSTASPFATTDGIAPVEPYWCLFQALSNLGEAFFFLLPSFRLLTKQVSGLGLLVEGNA